MGFLGLLFCSCEKTLDPGYPNHLLSEEAVFENESTVNAAIANIYSDLRDLSVVTGGPDGLSALLGLYADELDSYQSDSQIDNAFYNHIINSNNLAVAHFWSSSYSIVFNINSVVEGLKNAPLEEEKKEIFLGQALFIRAYIHFYLSQLFGDIPYIKTIDFISNSSVTRMPLTEVYGFIEHDLLQARTLLPADSDQERIAVSKGVATAMLARLYIYMKQWDKSYAESDFIIRSGIYQWEPDINNVFLKESLSTIWQLKPAIEGMATKEGELFIFDFGPPYRYALTDGFVQNFEDGDLRKENWVREISNGTMSWYHPYKYKQNFFEGTSTEYSILSRLAEQYLIRAESALHLGYLQQAKEDINIIRQRAGLTPTTATTEEELKEELMRQWKYEFFTEQGQRWFSLIRSGTAEDVLSPIKSGWKPTDILFPLPASELVLNPNLNPQNPGY